jgi:GTP-binding protein
MDQSDPIANYWTIRKELEQYSHELAQRPEIVVITKAELPGAEEIHQKLSAELHRNDIQLVSAATGLGMRQFVQRIAEKLAEYRSVAS